MFSQNGAAEAEFNTQGYLFREFSANISHRDETALRWYALFGRIELD